MSAVCPSLQGAKTNPHKAHSHDREPTRPARGPNIGDSARKIGRRASSERVAVRLGRWVLNENPSDTGRNPHPEPIVDFREFYVHSTAGDVDVEKVDTLQDSDAPGENNSLFVPVVGQRAAREFEAEFIDDALFS